MVQSKQLIESIIKARELLLNLADNYLSPHFNTILFYSYLFFSLFYS